GLLSSLSGWPRTPARVQPIFTRAAGARRNPSRRTQILTEPTVRRAALRTDAWRSRSLNSSSVEPRSGNNSIKNSIDHQRQSEGDARTLLDCRDYQRAAKLQPSGNERCSFNLSAFIPSCLTLARSLIPSSSFQSF